jgi:hypothetical protein
VESSAEAIFKPKSQFQGRPKASKGRSESPLVRPQAHTLTTSQSALAVILALIHLPDGILSTINMQVQNRNSV